ncbi:MAG: hypothetical protein LBK58_04980 [Prevotellaceae bacterium]|jgi:hypothetical protein|nr:hypothetical protein [Prevotellaceae bacterium]
MKDRQNKILPLIDNMEDMLYLKGSFPEAESEWRTFLKKAIGDLREVIDWENELLTLETRIEEEEPKQADLTYDLKLYTENAKLERGRLHEIAKRLSLKLEQTIAGSTINNLRSNLKRVIKEFKNEIK